MCPAVMVAPFVSLPAVCLRSAQPAADHPGDVHHHSGYADAVPKAVRPFAQRRSRRQREHKDGGDSGLCVKTQQKALTLLQKFA